MESMAVALGAGRFMVVRIESSDVMEIGRNNTGLAGPQDDRLEW